MNQKPKVSVIVPVYNGEKNLKTTIDSILNQTYKPMEVVCVDDCSTDASVDILESYGNKLKLIKHKKNMGGPAPTKNTGIKAADGIFCAFMDQDDIWFPEKIEKQVELFSSDPDIVACFTNGYILNNETGQNIAKRWAEMERFPSQQYCNERLLRQNFILSTTSAMIRKSILDEVGYFDENMKLADDYEMWIRLSNRGRLGFVEEPLFQWRFHTTSLSHNEEKHLTDLIYCYEKASKIFKDKYLDLIQNKLAIFHKRLGNYYMATGAKDKAIKSYRESLHLNPDQNLLKTIYVLSRSVPLLARLIVSSKRDLSQSIAKIDPDWTIVDKSTF